MPKGPHEGYNDWTMFKVYDAIREVGHSHTQAVELINEMQNKGILFREVLDTDEDNVIREFSQEYHDEIAAEKEEMRRLGLGVTGDPTPESEEKNGD